MTKRRLGTGMAVASVAVLATIAFAAPPASRKGASSPGSGNSEIQRGLDIAPVHLDLRGKNPQLVARGSYIVNAQGGCNDCHTCPPYTPEHDPFTGGDGHPNAENYLAGGTSFGPFVSKNITPDEESGLPAGLTRDEFVELIRTGHDPDEPGELLQVMPWPVFRNMTDRDLHAVYEYLSSIPHAERSSECVPEEEGE